MQYNGYCIIVFFSHSSFPPSLKKRLLSAYNLEKKAPIQWGITHEDEALKQYSSAGGKVISTGIVWLADTYYIVFLVDISTDLHFNAFLFNYLFFFLHKFAQSHYSLFVRLNSIFL